MTVGIDLVRVADVARSVERFGARYLERVFTTKERRVRSVERLAARFAAKEAVLKALSVGDEAVPWRDIEILSVSGGAPAVILHRRAKALAVRRNIASLTLSLTHEAGLAAAVVIGEEKNDG